MINNFKPNNYNLSLNLEREDRKFSGVVSISGDLAGESISLHSKDLEISSVQIDGKAADFSHGDFDELKITQSGLTPGEHLVVVGFSGKITDAMHGLYPCYYEHNGEKKELLATQFESHHAREVFPCVDEPEAKATFDLTLTTEKDITVLSNQPVAWQRQEKDKLVTAFETTPRMSTYLLAWVGGELHKKTATTKGGVEVNVWATHAQRPEALDFALDHAVKSIDFFDEYFDTPYPLPKSDHVALPDFSSGAMENWGLVTYREIALLADPLTTTVASKHYIATVISHELSHQWFGNLVTMKWWNDLWLNESFATLMEYIAVDAIHPEWNAWLDFASHESILALRRDATDGVQSVQVEVNHPDEISSLFDGAIVYAKGARLMRMCQDFIGHEAFREGLKTYFKEFAYKNTEASDLWRHLSQASGKDIAQLMSYWISTSGYPVLHVTPEGLKQEQFFIGPHADSSKVWPIPLGSQNNKLPELMNQPELQLDISNDDRFNMRDAGHFITHYNPEHLANLLSKLDTFDEICRLQLLHEQTLLARAGVISSAQLIDILNAYRSESSQSVWDIVALAFGELKKFVENNSEAEEKLRKLSVSLAKDQFERLGWASQPGESEADTKLRSLIIGMMLYGEDPGVVEHAKQLFEQGIENIDPEIRHLVISTAVKDDDSIVDGLLKTYRDSQSADLREDVCGGLTSVRTEKGVEKLLQGFSDGQTIRSQDLFRWFAYLMRNRYARQATWQWMKQNWQWIENTFAGDKSYDDFPRYAAAGLNTDQLLADFEDFFANKRNEPALKRTIELGITEIKGKLETLQRDTEPVVEKLKNLAI